MGIFFICVNSVYPKTPENKKGRGWVCISDTVCQPKAILWCYHHCNDKCYIAIVRILGKRRKKLKRELNHLNTNEENAVDLRRA